MMFVCIMLTQPYNLDPSNTSFILHGSHVVVFLFLLKNIDFGYSLELSQSGDSKDSPQSFCEV